jgi:hypothetical protein
MADLRSGDICPRCREGKLTRVPRRKWMRVISGSKHYVCQGCAGHLLAAWGRVIKLPSWLKGKQAQ